MLQGHDAGATRARARQEADMRRRDVLGAAGSIAAGGYLAAPAVAQSIRQLTMVTSWPADSAGLQPSAERMARAIGIASGGRIMIKVLPAGALVAAFDTFDAVGSGVADMYHSAEYYWERKSPAFSFFAAVPFGFTADELFAWVQYGGGQELWDALAAPFNIKPFLACNTGCQMGGWSTREIAPPEGFKGLRYRMPGMGGEVLRRMGAIVLSLPGGEILQAFRSGAINATEWVGPWLDMDFGLHKVADHYYYPGFHEPGTALALGMNRRIWESLDETSQRVIEEATAAEYLRSLAEFNANNAWSLRKLRDEGSVKILKFDASILKDFVRFSRDVVAEAGAGDELSRKIYASYQDFRAPIVDWSSLADSAFLQARDL
jgi:TRAP-type mannitol/chloroaromatic compound transport system substrate-binding protein